MRHRLTSSLLFMLQSQWSRMKSTLFDTFRHTQFNFIAPWPHFVPPPLPSSPVTHSPVHEWTLHVCVHQKWRFHSPKSKSGNFGAGLRSYWTGLGCAVHHRLRLSFVPTSPWPPSSHLPFSRLPSTCCECSFLLVRFSEACQFPLKCFGVFSRAFSGFVLHVHFNLLHVSYAFYGIQWRHSNRRQCFYNGEALSTLVSRNVMKRTKCKNSQDNSVVSIETNLCIYAI